MNLTTATKITATIKTLELTEKIKKEWIKALRSGKYKQGTGKLQKESRYCCLGVLQVITGLKVGSSTLLAKQHFDSNSCVKGLPIKTQHTLAEYNDGGYSFAQIADFIENGFKKPLPPLV